jgi:diacylglycerol kinase (ATP)
MSVPLGQMQYVAAVLGEMKDLTPVPYRIEIDGKRHDQEAVLVVAANTSYFGGGLKIAPDTDPADGLLDVIVVDACTRTELVKVLPKLFTGGHIGHPKVSVLRGRHIRLDAPRATTWADGERSGALPLTAECVPGALKMIVP